MADEVTLRQLQIDTKTEGHLDITIIDGDTVSLRDSRGRDKITLYIPDLYGKRQLPSPQSIDLVGGAPNTTYYLYATEPVPPWGNEGNVANTFRLLISTDGTLTFKHRLLFKLFTDGNGDIIATSEETDHFTTDEMHVYVNSATGDDLNDGLTADTAKATIQAGFDIIPFHINHNVVVHLVGEFTGGSIERVIKEGALLLIDGGDDITVIADDGGSAWVADISSSAEIGLSTLTWTPDEYEGYFVEILSGPCAGQTRMIQSHTATTITPVRAFSEDPLAAQFRIIRPATTISDGTLVCSQIGGYPAGGGETKVQRLFFGSTGYINCSSADGAIILSHIVSDNYLAPLPLLDFGMDFRNSGYVVFTGAYTDPTTLVEQGTSVNPYCGVKGGTVEFGIDSNVSLSGSVIKIALCFTVLNMSVGRGTKIHFTHLETCPVAGLIPLPDSFGGALFAFRSNGGHAPTTFGSGLNKFGTVGGYPPCIYAWDSSLSLQNCDVQGGQHNGIELVNSYLYLDGCISSTPNANAGVYAHSGSIINIRTVVAAPAITGTAVGDLTVDDAALASTWAAIFGGAPYASAAEFVLAKNYDIAWSEYTYP